MTVNPRGRKPPFFWILGKECLPVMEQYLSADQPFFFLESPEEIYEDFLNHGDIKKVAADYLQEIRQVQAHGPYYFGGFCLGALVACELARQVIEQGHRVALIFLLNPPPLGQKPPLMTLPLACHFEKFSQLGYRNKIRYLLNNVKNFSLKIGYKTLAKTGCIPQSIFARPIYWSAIRDYRPSFRADWTVIIKTRMGSQSNNFAWQGVTSTYSEIHTIDEYHENLLKEPALHTWLAYLPGYLKAAQALPCQDKH